MGNIECFGDRDDEYIDEEGDTEMVMLLNGEEVPVSEYNEETDKNNAIFMFRVGSTTLAKRAVSEEKFKSEVQTITDDSWVLPERTKSVVYKDSRQINLERLNSVELSNINRDITRFSDVRPHVSKKNAFLGGQTKICSFQRQMKGWGCSSLRVH